MRSKSGTSPRDRNQGSTMIYVIVLITLLSVFSAGYMAISNYNIKSALQSRNYMEAQLTAKSIHRSFSEAVSSGDAESMNQIWFQFQEDYFKVLEEYDALLESEEQGKEEVQGESQEEPEDWEVFLEKRLGKKTYKAHGFTEKEDQELMVDITLTAVPLEEKAFVHTKVECKGYKFSLKADIVFDNSDGAVMFLPGNSSTSKARSRSLGGNVAIHLNGNGVYRYYED